MVRNLPNTVAFNTVSHVLVTPTIKLFVLLLHNCGFATITDGNVNTYGDKGLPKGSLATG